MDESKYLIFLKGKDRTEDIQEFYSKTQHSDTVMVLFYGSAIEYPYNIKEVLVFDSPQVIDIKHLRIKKNNKDLFNIDKVLRFNNYVRIFYKSDYKVYSKAYLETELTIENSCLSDPRVNSVFEYLKFIANLEGNNAKKETEHLSYQYNKLNFIENQSVLATYLNAKEIPQREVSSDFIFPFGCNLSQMHAVKSAFESQISIIEGPPGTGKTQTILNIIANILLRDKVVAVVSNNNSATINVYEKLKNKGFGFLVAPLGKSENIGTFLENNKQLQNRLINIKLGNNSIIMNQAQTEVNNLCTEIEQLYKTQNEVKELKMLLENYKREYIYFIDNNRTAFFSEKEIKHIKQKKAEVILAATVVFETCFLNHRVLFPLLKLLLSWRYTRGIGFAWKKDMQEISCILKQCYYEVKICELENMICLLEQTLQNAHFSSCEENLQEYSLDILWQYLGKKYENKTEHSIFENCNCFSNIVAEYPIILSSTHSIRNCSKDYLFDYVIIDESSQVDIVTGALALSCAKNAVIVGDSKQLQYIVSSKIDRRSIETAFNKLNTDTAYDYLNYSILTSICSILPHANKTLLREHYRCHPKIIDFCNKKFYDNQLIIMTEDQGESDVLTVRFTVKGNHERDHKNWRQVDETKDIIKTLEIDEKKYSRDVIGIIAPYRDQVEIIHNDVMFTDISADTVHKFQGQEKKVIIISTVDNQITKFVADPKLLNVAISRAEDRLYIIVSNNDANMDTNIGDLIRYIQYNNFEIQQGQVRSIFDLLYKDYRVELEKKLSHTRARVTEKSEILMFDLLEEICKEPRFNSLTIVEHYPLALLLKDFTLLTSEEERYARRSWTHIDFVLFNKFNKQPVLAVEVDGYGNHVLGTKQAERDKKKNTILEKYCFSLVRCKTTESGERQKIVATLERKQFNN